MPPNSSTLGQPLAATQSSHLGSAWHKGWRPPLHRQLSDVDWVEAIHVLGKGHLAKYGFLVDVGGEGQLDQNTWTG